MPSAQAQTSNPKFDHLKTGFPLTGAHASQRCESCHVNGTFKGTPRDCKTCHTGGSRFSRANTVSPANHIPFPATQGCESCHGTQGFSGAKFSHSGVQPGTCQTCHDGVRATGKSATHIVTRAACDTCHKTTSWTGARPDHSAFGATTSCASCHNGSTASGKLGNHIPTSANCLSCHSTNTWRPSTWNHTQAPVSGQCASCHNGSFPPADGKSASHIATTAQCDSCHKSFTSWSGGTVDHSGFTGATQCASCHNGSTATGRPGNHMPVGATNCASCHATTGWKPTRWNHTQVTVTAQCATCHSGAFPPADGRPGNHIPYASVSAAASANCDTCHKGGFSAWNNGRFHANVVVSTQCASCHLSAAYGLTAKPATPTHANVTGGCESCHSSTSNWAAAKVDHSKFTTATQCASCHNGSSATGRPGTHIPVGATNCIGCHNTTGWTPTKWNHTQVTVAAQCATCHSGAFPPADGRPANHIPYASLSSTAIANCDSCHKGGYTSWNPGRFHANVNVIGQCASCHLTSAYGLTAKPSNTLHAGVTGGCESCHNTSGWTGAKVDHSKFTTATQCASCHNGSTATGKPGSHIPVGATNCIGCHSTTGWTPTKWNHTQVTVTAQCATCHSGAFPPADGRPTNHIPYQAITGAAIGNCDSCHKSGFASWNPGRFHANVTVVGQCSTCHLSTAYGLTAKPGTPVHSGIVSGCESCHKSTASWLTVTFTHSAANAVGTGTCDNCHNGSTAKGKPSNHIPIQVSTAKCDSCHKSQQAFITSVTMNHTAVNTMACKTCHNGSYTGAGAIAKPNNHIPEIQLLNGSSMDCKACHTSTNAGGFTTAVMNHNNSQGNGSGCCYACHNAGTAYLGNMDRKALTHRKSTGVTDCSQSGCHRPLGSIGATYRNWN